MWRLAFLRPFEDPTFGPDATGVMVKDPDGTQSEFIAFATVEQAISHLNSIGYEPMSAGIEARSNRWSMFWRKAEAPGKRTPALTTGAAEVAAGVAADDAAAAPTPRRRGRPRKAEAAASQVAEVEADEDLEEEAPEVEAEPEAAEDEGAEEAAPRRRGRPRKNAPAAAAPAPRKKRGRPKKR